MNPAPARSGGRSVLAIPRPRPAAAPRLGSTALPLLLVIGLVALSPGSAVAAGDDDPAALALLRRAVSAAARLSYHGTQVDLAWTADGMTTRTVEVRQAGGVRSTVVRPGGGLATTSVRQVRPLTVAVVDPLVLLAGAYAVTHAGSDRVAGRVTQVVAALRDGRVAARLWVDDATGLLVRQEIGDGAQRLTRLMAFVELKIDGSTDGAGGDRPGAASRLGGSSGVGESSGSAGISGPVPGTAELVAGGGARGWGEQRGRAAGAWPEDLPDVLPGGFRLVDVREEQVPGPGHGGTALHLTYCDGLSAVSVFAQEGRLPAGGVAGLTAQSWRGGRVWVGQGWPVRVVWQGGGRVFTVVSDAPPEQLSAVVEGLPGRAAPVGALGQIEAVLRAAGVLFPGR